jgi:type II secretory pathway predicted ATPase ExeA
MNWLTTAVATNVAYGSCTLLFGLLVLSIRSRRKDSDATYTLYKPPARTRRPVAANPKAEKIVKRILAPTHTPASAIDAKPKKEAAPDVQPMPKVTEEALSAPPPPPDPPPPPAPAQIPDPQISDEVNMNSPSFPFESLDPIAMSNLSALATSSNPPAFENAGSAPILAFGLVELEAPRTHDYLNEGGNSREMDAAPAVQMEQSLFTATAIHANEGFPESDEPIDLVVFPLIDEPVAAPEKTEGANLLTFFGLTQQPFDVTPDPSCVYLSASHSDALTSLQQGIEHFRGFMMLIAEPGMGKTTLLHKLMEEQAESARVVFLFQTQCNSRELLCYILNELEVDHTGMDAVAMHRALNQALLEEMLRGRRFVLIVDEAQNLQEPVLETIRLLSDFETTHSKLIQIVLAGQPQLAETLMRDSLVQLRQRISVLSGLKALSAAETAEYVDYRLRASGSGGRELFTREALEVIAETSGGVPRTINNYCFGALLKAFHRGVKVVDAELVKDVAGTLNLESLLRRPQHIAALQQAIVTPPPAVIQPATVEPVAEAPAAVAASPVEDTKPVEIMKATAVPFIGPLPNPEIILEGNLTEKVRSQGWSKRHEYRILVTLERDPVSGLPIADRYYCCSMYVDEAQAALLTPGKPVRIKIEQD